MLLGDAILVPITEVGSVACAIGWAASCAAYLALQRRSQGVANGLEYPVAWFGVIVAIALVLMKIIPRIPGHFTLYEWLALGGWAVLGLMASRRSAVSQSNGVPPAVQGASRP
jgi:drug/metabolite transporter (DMT)-like permease